MLATMYPVGYTIFYSALYVAKYVALQSRFSFQEHTSHHT